MTTHLATAMKDLARTARQKARDKASAAATSDPRADGRPSGAIRMAAPSKIRDPDATDDRVLRWGRYVVEHLSPRPGDVLIIKGPATAEAADKREKMADALEEALAESGIEDYILIVGPSHQANIQQISDQKMRDLGYVPASEATAPAAQANAK
jgi:hypothetical protein